MQRFIAELSKQIETADFERAWQNDSVKNPNVRVAFAFAGRRVYNYYRLSSLPALAI